MSDTSVRDIRASHFSITERPNRLRLQQEKYESLNKTKKRETVRKGETTLSDPFPFDTSARFSRWWHDVIYMAGIGFAKVHFLSISISFNNRIFTFALLHWICGSNMCYLSYHNSRIVDCVAFIKIAIFLHNTLKIVNIILVNALQSLIGKRITISQNINE